MNHQHLHFRRWLAINSFLLLLLIAVIGIFSFFGNPFLSPSKVFGIEMTMERDLFFHARLPRLLLAAIVGAGLSTSGVAFQSLLRNPLADPYILGVSGGAALGGVLALALGLPFEVISLIAFASGFGSLLIIYSVARTKGRLPADTLLLSGVIFNAFVFALIMLIHTLVKMEEAHQILYLLIGSLEAHRYSSILWVGFLTLAGFLVLLMNASKMNLVSLGEEPALQLGLDVERYRKVIFIASSIIVGATVSLAGLIGFVGLFVPHMVRLIFGNDHRLLLPASALSGGIFLIFCDFLARTLFSTESFQTQLPVGVITALIGGPFFLILLKRSHRN